MGAAFSADDCPLAVAAVAEITQFDLDQLRALCAACQSIGTHSELQDGSQDVLDDHDHSDGYGEADDHDMDANADLKHPVDLSWVTFLHALDVAKFAPSDRAILERMFTLMDKTGDEFVSRRELLVGACVLLQGDLTSKLQGLSAHLELLHDVREVLSPFDATAAVEIHRMSVSEPHGHRRPSCSPSPSHRPSYDALLFILSTFATVTSFFGDPLLKKTALSKAVHDVLDAPEGTEEKGGATNATLNGLAHHPVVERYIHQLAIDAESHEAV